MTAENFFIFPPRFLRGAEKIVDFLHGKWYNK